MATFLVLPALFEEANRMQRFMAQLRRALAAHGHNTVVPELPGQGESLVALEHVTLEAWLDAANAVAEELPRPLLSIAIRGGALLDAMADHRWRLAPESGARLLRDMIRATALSGRSASAIEAAARTEPTRLLGHVFAPQFFNALSEAEPVGDARVPDLPGQRLWRSAEPGEDEILLRSALDDILAWSETCAAF